MQASGAVNLLYNLLLAVYQDHLTKFVVLRPLKAKTAIEVADTLLDIICLIDSPHILQSDHWKEFKNVNFAKIIRELWPSCRIVHGKPRVSREGNREINKVISALMRKNKDPCWVLLCTNTQLKSIAC